MPARRSNWRQPNTFDDGGEAYTSSGRRTTRVSRGQKQQAPSSRSRARRDKDGTVINVSQSKAPAKLWVQVARPPAPGIRFVVPVWITADELTPEERAHLPAHVQQRLSGDAHNNNGNKNTSEPGTDADSPDAKRQKTESTTAAVPNENAVAVADSSTTDQVASAPATSSEPMITSPMATQDTAQSQPITSSQQPTLTANSTTISGLPDSSETVQPASEQTSSQITTTTTTPTPAAPSEGTGLAPNNATS